MTIIHRMVINIDPYSAHINMEGGCLATGKSINMKVAATLTKKKLLRLYLICTRV